MLKRPNNPHAAKVLDTAYTIIEDARRNGDITVVEALNIYQSLFVNAIAMTCSPEEAERFKPYLRAFKDAYPQPDICLCVDSVPKISNE